MLLDTSGAAVTVPPLKPMKLQPILTALFFTLSLNLHAAALTASVEKLLAE